MLERLPSNTNATTEADTDDSGTMERTYCDEDLA